MKKNLLSLLLLFIFSGGYLFAQDTLIGWTFPSGTKADSLANKGLAANKTQAIHLKSDSAIMYVTKTYASPPASAQAMGLSNATAAEKGWYIQFNSTGYHNLKLSSKQNACMTHSGPKYWKVQYKTGTGSWTDVPNANITCALNWTAGVLNNLMLPAACNNNTVLLRWVTKNDTNVPGAMNGTILVTDSSMSRIDDIFIFGDKIMNGYDTIIGYSFPTATASDSLANYGLVVNRPHAIKLKSDSAIQFISKTYASPPASLQAMGLSNATAMEKGWYIWFNSSGYDSLKLYSKQNACMTHSGPKYWKIQYKLSSGSWTDVPGGNVVVGLNWIKGVVKGIALPVDCYNNTAVNLRWITINDTNVPGAAHGTTLVTDSSMSRIDDIYVIGKLRSTINENINNQVKIYPVPNDGKFVIVSPLSNSIISIFNTLGEKVYENITTTTNTYIDLSHQKQGIYIIQIKGNNSTYINKILIK